jgi:hypothetical protein
MNRPRRPTGLPSDVDLTGGFRLNLQTMVLLGGLLFSWWNVRAEINQVRTEVTAREEARAKIEQSQSEARKVERDALVSTLEELKAQLKLTSLDIADLRVAVAGDRTSKGE